MKRDLSDLEETDFDLLIVGGGIFGACAAWEAVSSGLRVLLIEKTDFGHASSANHLKMVHGGIRYIQHADVYRIRESSRERSAFLRIAPHLVEPLPILIPTYGHAMKSKWLLGAAMSVYDFLTFDRNRNIPHSSRNIPPRRFLSADQVAEILPGIDRSGLTGAAVFCDGQMYNPPRLTMSFIRSAMQAGVTALNYTELQKIDIRDGHVVGADICDVFSRVVKKIKCRNILLTTGGWTHQVLKDAANLSLEPKPAFSRDLAFVVNRPLLKDYGFACPSKIKDADAVIDRGGRHLFFAPWRGKTLIGVWHGIFTKRPEEVATSKQELVGYLDEVNEAYPGFNLSLNDISMVLTGLTLFGESGDQTDGKLSFGKRSLLIDHAKKHQVHGLVSLIGVRATTARGMAEQAIKLILRKQNNIKQTVASTTTQTPVFGGDFSSFDKLKSQIAKACNGTKIDEQARYALMRNYGSEFQSVLDYGKTDASLLEPIGSATTLAAEVMHAVHEELAVKLSDVIFRRTDLGTLGDLCEEQIGFCAKLMARELSWDNDRMKEEVSMVMDHLDRCGFISAEQPSGGFSE